ncbi:uncharacterized protein PGTG_05414 [Puccinia graminis f. sp. tritici CRL 75-36-700-3]|uniref:Uncharacterized protein n=1 Tax=Puccinia graminis f. sp. tritici (strain CRL 75-36-700-3 / race SCCL) TaxID=418459 RepID=E3K483_PUCGT|nr:uncharacterized protein PGTG_05414 [Puccinia graminis f. sp. tritici CRL 75-36-700-3]EFP79093.2 hypothetical protein PGTG_05414 [Puccinia graminis f. sp. tritici CRL 75-36-700-3]
MVYEPLSTGHSILNPSVTTPPNNNNNNNNNNSNSNSNNNTNTSSSAGSTTHPTNTVESLLTLAHKRITTLVYLKKVHQGKVHWFNTILLSRPELEKWFDHHRMITRTTKFAILGMSLSSLLDINNLQDFLKAMINLLHEFESIPNDNFKPKITSLSRGIFKQSSKSARKSAGGAGTDYSITLQDSGDPSFIYTPNIPFDLDYFEVWITLSDMLVEVYQKMIKFISSSSPTTPAGTATGTTSSSTTPSTSASTSGSTSTGTTLTTSTSNPTSGSLSATIAGSSAPTHPHSVLPTPPTTTTTTAATTAATASQLGSVPIHVPVPPTRSSSNYSIVSVHHTYLNSSHIELISRIDSKLKVNPPPPPFFCF